MASYVTPLRATEFIFYIGLTSQANTKVFQTNPTLAAGDFKVSIDGGALANPSTLPSVEPAGGKLVKITLSIAEMTGDNIQLICSDAAGDEWCDLIVNIQTTTRQINDLAFPNTSGRGMDVTAGGAVGIDWANVENPTTTIDLSGTTVGITSLLAADAVAADSLSAGAISDISGALSALLTATVADSVPADGTRPSIASGILMITRFLMEKGLSGTTLTVRKEDGSTASMTFTLNSSTEPTSITRAT